MTIATKEFEALFKEYPLYSQENNKDPLVVAKLFDPYGAATWYLTEYDPEEKIAFVYVVDLVPGIHELGNISIEEIESIEFAPGVPRIEQDLHFEQKTLSEIKASLK